MFKSLFQQECLKRGVLVSASQNLCYGHGDRDIGQTLNVYQTALEICAKALNAGNVSDQLEGESVQPVFRQG